MARPVPAAIEPSPEPPAIPSERRTPRDWSHRAAVLVMVAVAVIAFARPLAGRGAFLGADINLPLPPWNADTAPGFRPYNWIVGDTLDAYIGKREIWDSLRSGHPHLWNDELGAGVGSHVLGPGRPAPPPVGVFARGVGIPAGRRERDGHGSPRP